MIRSMYTAITGMRSNQTRMDVIGNNIANANTTGFKRQRTTFAQMISQQLALSHPGAWRSTNPAFIGLGTYVSGINSSFTQGSIKTTGVATDLALNGDGFFLTKNPQGKILLSRAGNFTLAADGTLVTPDGQPLQGWKESVLMQGNASIGTLEPIKIDFNATSPPARTQNISIAGNLSADIRSTDANNSLTISSVAYDAQGKAHTLVITFTKTADLANGQQDTWSFSIKDASDPSTELASGTLEFDAEGKLASLDGTPVDPSGDALFGFSWDMDGDGTAEALNLNFGGSSFNGLTQFSGSSTPAVFQQDGHAAGELTGYTITPEGIVQLNFSNGLQENAYRLAIGTVNNPQGLVPIGNNYYELSPAAGTLNVGEAGESVNTTLIQGALEMSNVDLVTEFADMIVTQRGYQAAARIISTSDELIQETLQIKR